MIPKFDLWNSLEEGIPNRGPIGKGLGVVLVLLKSKYTIRGAKKKTFPRKAPPDELQPVRHLLIPRSLFAILRGESIYVRKPQRKMIVCPLQYQCRDIHVKFVEA